MSYISDLHRIYNGELTSSGIIPGATPLTQSRIDDLYQAYKNIFPTYGKYVNGQTSTALVSEISKRAGISERGAVQFLFIVRVIGGGSPSYSTGIIKKYNIKMYSTEWENPVATSSQQSQPQPQPQPQQNQSQQRPPVSNSDKVDPKMLLALLSYIFM